MSKMRVEWKPEGASARQWVIDMANPPWDLMYNTEKSTDWPWVDFVSRLEKGSVIAWRAVLWTLRKREETRLSIEAVEIDWSALNFEIQCPGCEGWIDPAEGEHKCESTPDEDGEAQELDPES